MRLTHVTYVEQRSQHGDSEMDMQKTVKQPASFACGMIGEGDLLIQCAEILIHHGHQVLMVFSDDLDVQVWAKEHHIPCYESINAACETSCDYFFYINAPDNSSYDTHNARFSIHYSNSAFPVYLNHACTSAIFNQMQNHTIHWCLKEKAAPAIILKQALFPIEPSETAYSLRQKCQEQAVSAFSYLVEELKLDPTALRQQGISAALVYNNQSKPTLPHTFIDWNLSAEDIERLYRALNYGSQNNPVGLLKITIGTAILVVRGIKVLVSHSIAPPGTILAISTHELHVTTASQNIAIRNLCTLNGVSCSAETLTRDYKLTKGHQLTNPHPTLLEKFAKMYAEYAQYEDYWIKTLNRIIPSSPIPLIPNLKNTKDMVTTMIASTTLEKKIVSVGQQQTLLTTLLIYLYRLNNYDDFTVNFNPEINMQDKDYFNKFFVSQLPLTIHLSPIMSFVDATQVISSLLEVLKKNKTYAHDVELRYPTLSATTHPTLISVAITSNLKHYKPTKNAAMTIVMNEAGSEFRVYAKKDIFSPCVNYVIANISQHIIVLLEEVVNTPHITIDQLSILLSSEKQLLSDWNNTKLELPEQNAPISYFFEKQAIQNPDHIAVTFADKNLSYRDLNEAATQVAQHLQTQGVLPNSLVAICCQRSLEMVIGILGILKSGAAYLPLDPHYPSDRLSYMLSDSQVAILLVDTVHPTLKMDHNLKTIEIGQLLAQKQSITPALEPVPFSPENLAYVIYTSGTTGKPKGVAITHRSLVNHMLWMIPKFHFTEKDVFLQKTPFSFDASIWEFFAPLLCGAQLIMASNENPLELSSLFHLIQQHKVTVLQLVPSILLECIRDEDFQACKSLTQVFSGGEALLPDTVRLFCQSMSAKLHNLYGPTETTIQVTSHSYGDFSKEQSETATLLGTPINNTQVYVLDKYLNPLPIGVNGELYIGGSCLAQGYLHQAELTQERFIKNPFDNQTDSRLYKTGDHVCWLPEGHLAYIGRLDNQLKLRGLRIETGEIEVVLSQHPTIQQCLVIQDIIDGSDHPNTPRYLIAYYTRKRTSNQLEAQDFVAAWKTLYQSEYLSLDINNFKQNISGWNCSYTDEAIEKEDMLEWINATTQRIKQCNPQIILEIGSGSGLVLFNMVDACDYYYATDFSGNVINYTNNVIEKFGYKNKVSTLACAADAVPYHALTKPYDTVVINSVIQYFPSLEYLETVIQQSIANMHDNGHIFIGDIRDFRLLKCFHYSVQAYKRGQTNKNEIDYFSMRDKELLVSPEYFVYLKTIDKNISHIEILPKLGKANHEMNNYRYDVILHISKTQASVDAGDKVFFNESSFTKVANLEEYLNANLSTNYLCIQYPNKRIARDYVEYNRLYNHRTIMNDNNCNNLWSMHQISAFVESKGYQAKYFCDVTDPFYLQIIIFKNSFIEKKDLFIDYLFRKSMSKSTRAELANNPLFILKFLENQLSNDLKKHLSASLPSYMIPEFYIPLEKFPLTINGKLDRKALPKPEFIKAENYIAPRNTLEKQVSQIWAEVLGLPEKNIGIHDDFFDLGGHSLSAIRMIALSKQLFSIKLPTRVLFDYPTIAEFSKIIHRTLQNPTTHHDEKAMTSFVIPLQREGFKSPLFLIHPIGGTIFWYKTFSRHLGNTRPIYAIQDPGIDANNTLFNSLEEMASTYLKAIQKIQPTGPYLLAGASFGATVAIEIAHQFLQSGEQVRFVGILDGWPMYSEKFCEKDFFENLMLDQFNRMQSQFSSKGINDIEFLLKLQAHRMSLLRAYKIPTLESLTYFRAEELWPVFKEMNLPLNCWESYSTQNVDCHLVPGNHETMFWEPHVQILAKKICESLTKAEMSRQKEQKTSTLTGTRLLSSAVL
jgi:amino acid adenylation domain-containing protein